MSGLARPSGPFPVGTVPRAADLLYEARSRERAGRLADATDAYQAAIAAAKDGGEPAVLAEALRRLAVVYHHRGDSAQARELCCRSCEVARAAGNDLLAADALNTLGGVEMMTGSLRDARKHFLRALELGGGSHELQARVEQNLGILANIQGELDEARTRYRRSLKAYQGSGDEHGRALAYHNLGMVSADRKRFDEADRYFATSRRIAERSGDVYLQGLCLVNHAEVHVARQRFEDARRDAESALAIFDRLGAVAEKSGACRVIGVVYRETGHPARAESQLRSALELAAAAGSVLNEAEASRELALLCQALGRNQEALTLLNAAHRRFQQLDARRDLVNVGGKMGELERTYVAVVREWGQSIELNDTYTFGHCERVAQNAVAVARALGVEDRELTTIRLGAYLHDVGKVRVPPEILNKPGPLSRDEFALVQMHPVWGVELLANVEFPWNLKPIIRWHHERRDGTGYPDRLRGDEIPVAAQIVGMADVYDALTTTRPYHPPLPPDRALKEITKGQAHWSEPVFEAFIQALPTLSRERGCRDQVVHGASSEQAA